MKFEGHTAVVTGASRGIGREIALRLVREGADVGLVARDTVALDEVARVARSSGRQVWVLPADLSLRTAVTRLVSQVDATMPSVDILVNNVGVQGPIGLLTECSLDEWLQAVQTNLLAPALLMRGVLPRMVDRRRGTIVNLSGGGALTPRARFSAYAAAKAALVRLTETVAEEVRAACVRVNAMAPGAINTRMLDEVLAAGERAGSDALAQAERQRATGGSSLERAVDLAMFLASDDSAPLTGKVIAAPHDRWDQWTRAERETFADGPWLTLRRLDPFAVDHLPSLRP